MLSITTAVRQIVRSSDFATEGLQNRCLNLSAFAELIHDDLEKLTKKQIHKGSTVVALSRVQNELQKSKIVMQDFKLHNLVSRTGLSEVTYTKTPRIQSQIAAYNQKFAVQSAQFYVVTTGLTEISIITHTKLAENILESINDRPRIYLSGLSGLTMQVAIETIDMPRQSYSVIKQLALRDITIVEYITSPTELTIILYERDLKQAFNAIHDKFFAKTCLR